MASKIKGIGEKGTFMHQVGARQVEEQHMLGGTSSVGK